jgi:20S proteasome alpha/beta subunit
MQKSHISIRSRQNILIGATGRLADFQILLSVIKRQSARDEVRTAGSFFDSAEVRTDVKPIQDQPRSKVDSLIVKVVIAGFGSDGAISWSHRLNTRLDVLGSGEMKRWEGCGITELDGGSS